MNHVIGQWARRFWKSPAASWLLYLVVIVITTWPLVRSPLSTLTLGPVKSSVVPMFNLWSIWWNADQAAHAFQGYWQAPIFFPEAETFAFSEPQPTTLLVAPLIWITGSRVLAYNAYFWLSYLLNGVMTESLLRRQGVGRLLARCSGIAMILLPILQWQRDVVQLVPVWGILWVWITFGKLARESRLRHGLELGVAAATTIVMCMHYGLFLAILSAGTGWVMVGRWRAWSTWKAWIAGTLIASALAGPMIWHVHRVLDAHQFERDMPLITQLSLQPGDYTAVWGRSLIPWGTMAARDEWRMSPGWIKVGLALLGVGLGLARRRNRRWTLFLTGTAMLAILLSLGTNFKWGEFSVWGELSRVVPGFSQVRSAYRFAVFVQMSSVLLAAQGLHLLDLWSRRRGGVRGAAACRVLPLIAGLIALETLPWKTQLWTVPEVEHHLRWIEYVRRETPPGRAILCLPFPTGFAVSAFEPTTNWMYFGTFHSIPMLNGYSGFFPESETKLRGELAETGVTSEFLDRVSVAGAEFLVVDTRANPPQAPLPSGGKRVRLNKVLSDAVGVEVYRLVPIQR